MKLLYDMSSILWMSLLAGKDTENGREVPNTKEGCKPVWVNSAEFGFENFVNSVVSTLNKFGEAPRNIVMVFDGKHSKAFRQVIYPEYKAGRDHPEESYAQFERLKEMARATLAGLGATAVWQDGLEADDVLCYLTQHLKTKHAVISNDGDLLVLQGPNTDVYRDGEFNVNKYGPFPFRHITLYKALVGDRSDGFTGAKGFGAKSFIELYCRFGEAGLDLMVELIKTNTLDRLVEDLDDFKALQKIIDAQEMVTTSYALARMYPERVNTARLPMQVQAGMLQQWDKTKHDERLKHWYGASRIVHAANYLEARGWALEKLLQSEFVSFDIETSTGAKSDEWIEECKRANGGEEGSVPLDVLGSELTGASLTFGNNQQYSLYFTVDHVETAQCKNVRADDLRTFMELIPSSKPIVVQNASFELSVVYQTWGEKWKNNGYEGFLPNILDTKIMKSYVDENSSMGLKQMSESILGYKQTSYGEVTQGRKMNQMTAAETVAYGNDDTICTSALYTYLRFMMEIEGTWDVYLQVDVAPAYLNAQRFLAGVPISTETMMALEKEDDAAFDAAWGSLREFLMASGWEGTVCPAFTCEADFTPATIKEVFEIVTGSPLETQVRTPSKLFVLVKQQDELLGGLMEAAFADSSKCGLLNHHIRTFFKGDPLFNSDSPKQMQRLLYEALGLPIRLRNKPTDAMRAKGIKDGGARTDDLAVQFALTFDAAHLGKNVEVLKAIQTMKSVATKRKLYYIPYRNVCHWKDGLVHSQLNQCQAKSRRYSESAPNKQQLPKHPKQGKPARFREVFVPHKKNAVVVSMDFTGQELRLIADRSRDQNMLDCFIGEHKKDMHSITGVGILRKKAPQDLWALDGRDDGGLGMATMMASGAFQEAAARWHSYSYESFEAALNDPAHQDYKLLKVMRALGKKTNFTTEYGAQAPKLAETLICERDEAQQYIEAKQAAFPRAEEWKKEVIKRAHQLGYAETLMGARRHLPDLRSSNKFDVARAERQAVNFWIQGSAAEMTKLVESRLWKSRIFSKYDARYIGPIHDELVASVVADQALDFITEVHSLMTQQYADMTVPIVSSISFGPNFGIQHEVGETVDPELISETLAKMGFETAVA